MWDLLRSVFGEVSPNELALVGVFFLVIVTYPYLPRLGEAVGAMLERRQR